MDNEPLDSQIHRLADCILAHYPAEPGRGGSEGAVDVAIRLLTAQCPNARYHDQPTPPCPPPADGAS
jgi:hypothetical protein